MYFDDIKAGVQTCQNLLPLKLMSCLKKNILSENWNKKKGEEFFAFYARQFSNPNSLFSDTFMKSVSCVNACIFLEFLFKALH